jgi:hypothetical protein
MRRNRIRTSVFTLLAFAAGTIVTLAQSPAPVKPESRTASAKPVAVSSGIIVPVDTTIPVELRNTISTRTASAGDSIYCDTIYPVTVGNRIVIPVGSYVKGSVTQVVRPGRVKGRGQLGLRFDSVTLPNGTTLPLRATLSGYGGNGREGFKKSESKIEGESSKGHDAGTVAQSTVAGAEIGTIAGGLSGGHAIKGLGIGSAAGAGAGAVAVLLSRGKEIVLPPGTNFELQLLAPLRFEAGQVDPPSPYDEGPSLPRRDPGSRE